MTQVLAGFVAFSDRYENSDRYKNCPHGAQLTLSPPYSTKSHGALTATQSPPPRILQGSAGDAADAAVRALEARFEVGSLRWRFRMREAKPRIA